MSKHLYAVLIFSFLIPHQSKANSNCELLLLNRKQQIEVFSREMKQLIQGTPRLRRLSLTLQAQLKRNQILKNCSAVGSCTEEMIVQAVREEFVKTDMHSRTALLATIWIGGLISSAAMSAELTVLINKNAHFLPTFLSNLTQGIMMIMSALLVPFSAHVLGKIYSFAHSFKPISESNLRTGASLESTHDQQNKIYTLQEQNAADVIAQFSNYMMSHLLLSAQAIQNRDKEAIVQALALISLGWFAIHRAVEPSEPLIFRSIQAYLLKGVENPMRLMEPILAALKEIDPKYSAPVEVEYRRALGIWLGP